MPVASRVEGDFHVNGGLSAKTMTLADSCVTNAKVAAAAAIDASKVIHQYTIDCELFGPATTITALTKLLHIVRGATGTVVAFEGITITPATGADRTVTIDLQKSTGAGAFATILTATIGFTDDTVARTATAATLDTASLVDGDILQAVVTVAGSAGNQALGLLLTLTLQEAPA